MLFSCANLYYAAAYELYKLKSQPYKYHILPNTGIIITKYIVCNIKAYNWPKAYNFTAFMYQVIILNCDAASKNLPSTPPRVEPLLNKLRQFY